ncbi:MAG: DNA-processing protein DprA, partial [Clostridia bacterium]|nr:DNA-processing protein DprA [Clostridia bacterium]
MIRYLIWLQQALGPGNIRSIKALSYFGDAEKIFTSKVSELEKSKIFTKKDILKLQNTSLSDALKIMADCKKNNIEILGFGDKKYPDCLSQIDDAPLVLYVKGELLDFDNTPTICIVGPRKVSEFGKRAAYSLGYRLAASG